MPTYDSFLAEAVRQAIETEVGKVEKVGLNKDGFAEVRVIETERLSHFVLEVECAVVFPAGKMTPSAAGTCVEKSQYTFYIHISIFIFIFIFSVVKYIHPWEMKRFFTLSPGTVIFLYLFH